MMSIRFDATCGCDSTSSHFAVFSPSRMFVNEHVCFEAKSKSFYRRLLEIVSEAVQAVSNEFSFTENRIHDDCFDAVQFVKNSKQESETKKIVKCLIARHFVRVCSNYFTGMSRIFVLVYNCVLCIFIIYFGKCDVS